jgi:hypothetical protein
MCFQVRASSEAVIIEGRRDVPDRLNGFPSPIRHPAEKRTMHLAADAHLRQLLAFFLEKKPG